MNLCFLLKNVYHKESSCFKYTNEIKGMSIDVVQNILVAVLIDSMLETCGRHVTFYRIPFL